MEILFLYTLIVHQLPVSTNDGKGGKVVSKAEVLLIFLLFCYFLCEKFLIFEVDLIKASISRGQHMSLGIVMEDTLTLSDIQGGDDNDHQE